MNRKPPHTRRTHRVKVSLNDDEYARLMQQCDLTGRKPGTYCRIKTLEPDSLVTLTPEMRDLRSDLGRIGNNLNQLAHHLNLGNPLDRVEALALKHELTRLKRDLVDLRQALTK
ncbi:MAG: plasmid mobilization relaxosome protein MobC [Cyanobacteria bacterium P01_A01_bin.17]